MDPSATSIRECCHTLHERDKLRISWLSRVGHSGLLVWQATASHRGRPRVCPPRGLPRKRHWGPAAATDQCGARSLFSSSHLKLERASSQAGGTVSALAKRLLSGAGRWLAQREVGAYVKGEVPRDTS